MHSSTFPFSLQLPTDVPFAFDLHALTVALAHLPDAARDVAFAIPLRPS